MPKYTYFDRHGRPLVPGQQVVVQHCVGRYGRVKQTRGLLKSIGSCHEVYIDTGKAGEGNCLYPGFNLDAKLGERAMRGYEKFTDFEHGHEKWIEIVANEAQADK